MEEPPRPSATSTTSAAAAAAGLYIHIPFCVVRCTYCDFYSQVGADHLASPYIDAIVRDVGSFPSATSYSPVISSLFLGGGTPSYVESDAIGRVIAACRAAFRFEENAEVTIEANPESLTAKGLAAYRSSGVNRVSIGIQSLRPELLEMMGRPHGADEAFGAIRRAREAGFDNVSADFIYGLPGQSFASWREDLDRIVDLGLDHLSAYILETEKDTPLARELAAGRLEEPDPGEIARQYDLTCDVLECAGYLRYEISNYARPGRECRHNMTYWNDRPYLGFGASAHGYWNGQRVAVRKSAQDYIAAVGRGERTFEVIDPPDREKRMADAIVTGLRLAGGCDFDAISNRYGVDLFARHRDAIADEIARGRLARRGGVLSLTRRGILFSNDVLCRFV